MTYVDVRRHGKLLFRFDPERDLIQIVRRGETETVDLKEYRRNDDARVDSEGRGNQRTGTA